MEKEEVLKYLKENFENDDENRVIKTRSSYVTGFDPETKKGFKTITVTLSYQLLIKYRSSWGIATRSKIIFDNGVVSDWHWVPGKEPDLMKEIVGLEPLR